MPSRLNDRMSRRWLVLLLPALALIAWLLATQLPRWTAPQASWFGASTPGVCAAVESLVLYQAARTSIDGISVDTAKLEAAQVAVEHYDASPTIVSDPLAVQATLPGAARQAAYVVTVKLSTNTPSQTAVIYLDGQTGQPLALITAIDDPAAKCDFDVRAALVAAVKSPPLPLLIAYVVIVTIALLGWRLIKGLCR